MKQCRTAPSEKSLTIDNRFVTDIHRAKLENSDINDIDEELIQKMQMAVTASAFCTPEVSSAAIIQDIHRATDIDALVDELCQQTASVRSGSLDRPKAMLMAQAQALDSLFFALCKRSLVNAREGSFLDAADRYMRLALKAQSQAVRTLEVLGDLVNPRSMAFVGQANIAHGPQQVNNLPASEKLNSANQTISEADHELQKDTRTPEIEGAINSSVETLEKV